MKVAQSMRAAPQARRMQWLFVSSISILLTACGGGGGGGNSGGSTPPPTPPAQTNTAPTVQAGADQTIQLPTNSVSLTGSATDAENNAITYAWTATPTGVTFASASSAATTATFPGEGTYTLTLTANDGTLSGTDTLVVTVQAAPAGPANAAPTVDAGNDQTIELPTSSIQLQPTVSDDGLPTPAALTYAWTVTTGSGVTLDNASTATATARFTTAGTYTLQLAVNDGTLSATDTVQVVVNPAVFPGADWATVTPAEAGMNETLLNQARDHALTGGGSGFIARKGRRVFTWGDQTQRGDVKSTTKSIGGIALGLAIDDGRLTLEDLARVRFPGFGGTVNAADPRMNSITVLQLATHSAGFPKDGGEHPLDFDPGTTWQYSDGGLNWLADTLTYVYAQDLHTLLNARVFTPLGITGNDLRWRTNSFRTPTLDVNGTAVNRRELAAGITVDVDAMARIGHLFLRRGAWGDQRILSEAFVDRVRQPRSEIASLPVEPTAEDFPNVTRNYGILWWTNASGALPNVPTDAYWAWGLYDSLLVVIPSLDLVIARTGTQNTTATTGRTWNDSDWNGDYTVLAPFLDPIVQSVTP